MLRHWNKGGVVTDAEREESPGQEVVSSHVKLSLFREKRQKGRFPLQVRETQKPDGKSKIKKKSEPDLSEMCKCACVRACPCRST